MIRRTVIACALCLTAHSGPLLAQEPVDQATIARIKDEAISHSRVGELFGHLANVVGQRITNSPSFREAVDWSVAQLKQAGLTNVHTEAWPFGRGWALEQLTLEMTEPQYFPLIGYAEAWSPSTKGELVGTPVYIGDLRPHSLMRIARNPRTTRGPSGSVHHRTCRPRGRQIDAACPRSCEKSVLALCCNPARGMTARCSCWVTATRRTTPRRQ
jgi:hypothetical protein